MIELRKLAAQRLHSACLSGVALAALLSAAPARAQDSETGDAPSPEPTAVESPTPAAPAGRQVYTPADFARYAP